MQGTSLLSTPGQFGPVLLPYVSKNDDKEHCFLKKFGFSIQSCKKSIENWSVWSKMALGKVGMSLP